MTFQRTTRETRFIRNGHTCLGVTGPVGLTLTVPGHNNSLLWSRPEGETPGQLHAWSPWGHGNPVDKLPAFNGERIDPISGTYHLGNGYRAYNPLLRRFNCPDSMSPFGPGGINPYAYCAGDPINHTDPSGHISWQGIVGIIGGVIGLGLSIFTAGTSIAAAGGIAAALSSASTTALVAGGLGFAADVTGIASGAAEDANPQASSVLGWVSMATGFAGMIVGVSQILRRSGTTVKYSIDNDHNIISMGGQPAEHHILSENIVTFYDSYKKSKRLNILGHGHFIANTSDEIAHVAIRSKSNFWEAEELAKTLKNKNLISEDVHNIRLLMCFSADGGSHSFAQKLAFWTNKNVKGYVNKLYITNYISTNPGEYSAAILNGNLSSAIFTPPQIIKKGLKLKLFGEPYRPLHFHP